MLLLGPRVRRVGVKCYAGLRRRELVGLASLLLPHYLHAGRDHVMESVDGGVEMIITMAGFRYAGAFTARGIAWWRGLGAKPLGPEIV
jgi:hypothetical protein